MLLNRLEDSVYVEDADVTQPFDERKPRVPYVKGWRFTAQQHIPPPPIKMKPSVLCTFKDKEEAVKMKQLHPFERCLQYPPLPGSYGSSSLELQINEIIRIGDHHNAQPVVVEVLTANPSVKGLSKGQCVVAKLYDPMYIDDDQFYINPFVAADKGYTYETAAYMALSDLQGSAIPQYYGSYSLDIPVGPTENKYSVRLILIELISGLSMQKADPDQFPQKLRQNIMKFLIEFEALVYSRNILMRDLHPRNVMVTTDSCAVVIDFADADIGWGALSAQSHFKSFEFHTDNYVPPLVRWHEDQNQEDEFYDWIDWDWQSWLQAEFANTAESITPGMLEYYMSPPFLENMGGNVAEGLRMVVGG